MAEVRINEIPAGGTEEIHVLDDGIHVDVHLGVGPQGPAGEAGQDGAAGADGYSPTASVSKSGGTATITITDKDGTTTAQVSDGAAGSPGAKGDPGDDYVLTNEDKAEIAEIAKDELIVATVAETKQYIGIA